MPDRDERGSAWKVPPSRYLAGRPAEHRVGAPSSVYVTMADGCRLAVDVILPDGDASKRWPTVLILTPYVRRFAVTAGSNVAPSPNSYRYRDMFVPRGYAVVVVDARGTGASFGTRDSFRSPRERDDYRAIADWIVGEPWSDGRIGATGISYLGAAADFLASTGHPAVKAIAPLFSVWDTYSDHYYPGGVLLTGLAETYERLIGALDNDRREVLRTFAYFADPNLCGPARSTKTPTAASSAPRSPRIAAISACRTSSPSFASRKSSCPTTRISPPPRSAPIITPPGFVP